MTYSYPFFSFPHIRRYSNYYPLHYNHTNFPQKINTKNSIATSQNSQSLHKSQPSQSKQPKNILYNLFNQDDREQDEEFFEIFGLKLYHDDLLLLGLIFFLYKEDVKDQYLFFSLILLLLS